jgi:hydrogenase nickel incorporation protein HypA/HybF
VPARLTCRGCEREWEIELPLFRCPSCGGAAVEVVSGDEFEVESIEVEEAACTAPR